MSAAVKIEITTRWHDEDVLQCLHGGVVVAEAFWNGGEWVWFAKLPDGETDTEYTTGRWIEVDPETERHMREIQQANALMLDSSREAADAVLKARRRMFRDDEDNRNLVRVRAMQLARQYVRDREKP